MTKSKQDWEKEFEIAFTDGTFIFTGPTESNFQPFIEWCKGLIRKTLQKEKKRIRKEVENMKVGPWKKWIAATKSYGGTREEWKRMQESSYDETLDQALKLLEENER